VRLGVAVLLTMTALLGSTPTRRIERRPAVLSGSGAWYYMDGG
jgi:hypothetical protein